MRATVWKLHQWLGLITCVGMLMWGLSGISHPIMSRLQPKPAAFMPPAITWDASQAANPQSWLKSLGINTLDSLHTVKLGDAVLWLAHPRLDQAGLLIDPRTGVVTPDGEPQLAQALARHYTGLMDARGAPVAQTRLITAFNEDYLPVNRLLPVWQVTFDRPDHLSAYIDTRQMRLATLNDDTKRSLGQLFRWGHNWSLLDAWPRLQVMAMTVALCCALLSAMSGLYFGWTMRASATRRLSARPVSRWHRRLGLTVALTSLAFAFSGLFHLWTGALRTPASHLVSLDRPVSTMTDQAWAGVGDTGLIGRVDWVADGAASAWWVQAAGQGAPKAQVAALAAAEHAEHAEHQTSPRPQAAKPRARLIDAQGLSLPDGAKQLAIRVATQDTGWPAERITDVRLITRFDGEYGFLNKRLPVWRMQFDAPGTPRVYVELATGAIAARVNNADAVEGWSFSVLHKWNIGNINKDLRDVLVALFALGNVVVACLGLTLFWRPTLGVSRGASSGQTH
ncbi:MAG: PepSY domain-containing protein [Aquabacterium sp.]|nr:PepSY domain-containing protein [Aquabacterium sp.]